MHRLRLGALPGLLRQVLRLRSAGAPVTGPAVPPGGEQLREAVTSTILAAWRAMLPDETFGEAADRFTARILALPAVREALAAQATLRRYANDPPPTSEQLRRNRELEATVARVEELAEHLEATSAVPIDRKDAASRLRRALAGDPS